MSAEPSPTPDPDTLGSGIDFTDPNSPLAPYYLRASHVAAVVVLALVFVVFNAVPLWYTDVWGHLKFGQWIVQHRQLPDREPFSPYADPNTEYINFQWLSQVGGYLCYAAGERLASGDELHRLQGGVAGLLLAQALLAVLFVAFALLAYRRAADSLPLACVSLILLAGFSVSLLGHLRPQVVGIVLFVVVLAVLSRRELARRECLLLPLAFVLWANSHGSFLVGLYLIGLFLFGRLIEVCITEKTWNPLRAWKEASVRLLALTLALSALACCLNPHGPRLFVEVLRMSRNPNVIQMDEWKPLFSDIGGDGQVGYVATLLVIVLSWTLSRRWPTSTQILILLGFGLLPLLQQRMMIWWVGLVPWLVVPHWRAIFDRLPWSWLHRESVLSFRKTVVAGLIAVVAFLMSSTGQWLLGRGPRPLEQMVTPATPWRLADQLTTAPSEGSLPKLAQLLRQQGYPNGRLKGPIFASETLGDFLLWYLPGENPVLLYTHVHLFTAEHCQKYLAAKFGEPDWKKYLDARGVNLVVVEAEGHPILCDRLRKDPDWIVMEEKSTRPARQRVLIALRRTPL